MKKLFILSLLFLLGCTQITPPQPQGFIIHVSSIQIPSPKYAMGSQYTPESFNLTFNTTSYPLPLNLSAVENLPDVEAKLSLTEEDMLLLERNGFVVIPYGGDDIVKPYKRLKARDVPIFVTTDTVLHLYHIQFNEALKEVEEKEFYPLLINISQAMLQESERQYSGASSPDVKEAARRNMAYFAVGLKLLEPSFDPPDVVRDDVMSEISNIEGHAGFINSTIFKYKEDYSQYLPRGHYTASENLKRYFKSMMWYGRMAFLLRGGCLKCYVSEEDARIQTLQAILISSSMDGVPCQGRSVGDAWRRIYGVTSFFVGLADDLTPYEYWDAVLVTYGTNLTEPGLNDDAKLTEVKGRLAGMRMPKIYGGTGFCEIEPPFTQQKLEDCLKPSQGMRFMGQRYIPDSYIFQNLVFPMAGNYTGPSSPLPFTACVTPARTIERCFPRGLDVMAVLGSERAFQILEQEGDTDYLNYSSQISSLRQEFSNMSVQEWNRNLYLSWLYSLKPLLREREDGYPSFMRTQAWQDRSLRTCLASWTELRHDTILYGKQSYTPRPTIGLPSGPLLGYVEPEPEFYARMLALTRMTREGLREMDALSQKAELRMTSLESILQRLIDISITELEGKELSQDDYMFIKNFGESLEGVVMGVKEKGKETTLVADVHTDTNTFKVLEEGVGKVELIIVAYKLPDGRTLVGAGPVLSYYEFKHPMQDRLTDEKWKDMLDSSPPSPPDWVYSFRRR